MARDTDLRQLTVNARLLASHCDWLAGRDYRHDPIARDALLAAKALVEQALTTATAGLQHEQERTITGTHPHGTGQRGKPADAGPDI